MRIAIAGAGIAGLTAAIALARRGFGVDLHERAVRLEEIGAGIQLSPNATAVLTKMGIMAHLDAHVCYPESIEIGDAASGRLLASIPLGAVAAARYGHPYALIHRADLQAALLAAAGREPHIAIHFGSAIIDLQQQFGQVDFRAGGLGASADILIAADGIHSALRTAALGGSSAIALRKTAWRAILPMDTVPRPLRRNVTNLWFANGFHLVHYPLRKGAVLNVVVIGPTSPSSEPPLHSLIPPLQSLLAAIPSWRPWPLFSVDPRQAWSKDRIVLIGDAAHAMPPTAAQGGAQAIEDAWILAAALEASGGPAEAFRRFEGARRARVARIARKVSRDMRVFAWRGFRAALRDAAIRVVPGRRHLASLDWLYGWKPS